MPHIALCRQTETGEVLARFEPRGVYFRIVERAPQDSACLRFIDPYGDTIFNQLQIPVLAAEIARTQTDASEKGLQVHIGQVLAFLAESEDVHVYLRFVGE